MRIIWSDGFPLTQRGWVRCKNITKELTSKSVVVKLCEIFIWATKKHTSFGSIFCREWNEVMLSYFGMMKSSPKWNCWDSLHESTRISLGPAIKNPLVLVQNVADVWHRRRWKTSPWPQWQVRALALCIIQWQLQGKQHITGGISEETKQQWELVYSDMTLLPKVHTLVYKTFVYFGWSVFLNFKTWLSIAGLKYGRTVQRFVVSLWCAKGRPVAVQGNGATPVLPLLERKN